MSLVDTPDFTAQPDVSNNNYNNSATDTEGGERFFLEQLNITVSSELATLHGGNDTTPLTADSWANLNIPVSYARNLFQYQVDGIDVNDENADDIKFRMFHLTSDTGGITDASNNLAFYNSENVIPAAAKVYYNAVPFYGNSNVNSNSTQMTVNADFVRHIAKEVFGVAATDLFSNELYVRNKLNADSNTNYVSKIDELVNLTTDASGGLVLMNDISGNTLRNNFPSKLIFKQMLDNVRSRFADINGSNNELVHLFDASNQPITLLNNEIFDASGVRVDPSNSQILWRKLPFMVGDMLFFNLTLNPDANQNAQTGNVVDPRSYRIRLKLVADNDATVENVGPDPIEWTDAGWNKQPLYTDTTPTENAPVYAP
jgi:hypothetical protein